MINKTAKLIRRYARATGKAYKPMKRAYNQLPWNKRSKAKATMKKATEENGK